jgi:hypothetical protein
MPDVIVREVLRFYWSKGSTIERWSLVNQLYTATVKKKQLHLPSDGYQDAESAAMSTAMDAESKELLREWLVRSLEPVYVLSNAASAAPIGPGMAEKLTLFPVDATPTPRC